MFVQIASDLHIEFSSFVLDCTGVDVLVLAGDIHCRPKKLVKYVNKIARRHENLHIILVAGNHEFYSGGIGRPLAILRDKAPSGYARLHERVHFLEDGSIKIGGVNFIGATLWCNPPEWARPIIAHTMTDFGAISDLTWKILDEKHCASRAAIKNLLRTAGDEPVVVATHFPPSLSCVHPKFLPVGSSAENYYYANDLEALMLDSDEVSPKKPTRLWVHGHTHSSLDFAVGETWRVVCNPRGYSKRAGQHPENEEFDPRLIIEVND